MKKILLFAFLLCSFSAFAQYPAQPTTKQELGRQTTGDGLIYRGSGAPAYTPVNNRNAWIYYDTTNNRLYKSRLGAWSLMVQDTSAFNEIQMPYIIDDTLYLTQNVTGEPLTRYVNRVWPITNLSDTTSITGENQGDIAIVASGDTVAFRGSAYWNPFSGGGGGGTFNSFNIAGDTGNDVITDGQTVTVAGGHGINTAETGGTVTVTADTTQLATQSDISGFGTMSSFTVAAGSGTPQTITNGNTVTIAAGTGITTTAGATDQVTVAISSDSTAAWVSGTGTNLRIPRFTGANSIGNSTLLQSSTGVGLDANLAFQITGGTTASRPTGAAGMMYWNTSNTNMDVYVGSAWNNYLYSNTSSGAGTAGRVFYAASNGTAAADDLLYWNSTINGLGIGASPSAALHISSPNGGAGTGMLLQQVANNVGPTISYASIDFQVPTTGLIGQFLSTASNYSSGAVNLAGNSIGLTSLSNQLWFAAAGFVNFNAGGFGTSTERMRITSAGLVGIGTTSPDRLLHSELSDAVTNAMGFPLRLTHITSGTAAAGSGAGMEFEAESAGGTNRVAGTIENPYTTATNAAEVSDLVFRTMRAGTLTESLRSLGNGTLQVSTLSGTASKIGAFTSGNIATVVTPTITTAGTTGDRTINELAGTVNIAAAGTTVTVTNSLVTANSLVFCTLRTNDTTATVKNVVPTAGSFTINLGAAATGEVSIGFFVVN